MSRLKRMPNENDKTKRWPRLAELFLIYAGLPLIVFFEPEWIGYFDRFGIRRVPKIPMLLLLTFYCLFRLLADRSFDIRQLWNVREIHAYGREVWRRFGWGMLVMFVVAAKLRPDDLFVFPRERVEIWRLVMLLYPVLSAYPQEIVYRAYFFQRYERLLGTAGTVIASTAAFAFLHIVFDNWPAVLLTILGGAIFSITYRDTRSLYVVTVEHALYGCFGFTVGLGRYFFEGR